jgi:hypothetical protein
VLVASHCFETLGGWSEAFRPELDSESTAVFVFGASDVGGSDAPLAGAIRALRDSYPRSHMVGCSTAGEIHGTSIRDRSLSVGIARFERSRVAHVSAPVDSSASSFVAGQTVARSLSSPDLRAVVVLSDGLCVNGSELIRGLNSVLPPEVVVTGGLAGDGSRFQRTWVLDGGVPTEARVTALGLYGPDVRVGHGSQGGWDIFGPERRITRSSGNVLYEIDGKPALALYKNYLGEQAAGLPSTALLFPLALRASKSDEKTLVRTILSVDEATSSMTFAGDVPEGLLVQLMRANMDRLIDGASGAALATAKRSAPVGKSLTLAVSCVGRRLVLGERTEEEIEAATRALPRDTTLVGFYSYGEISPYATGACDLHNQTMTLTNLWES